MPIHVTMTGRAPAGTIVDPGTYDARVIDAEQTVSKAGGNPQFHVTFSIEEEGPFLGATLPYWITFAGPKTEPFWKATLIALGWDPEDLKGEGDLDIDAEELIDRECRVVVVSRSYTVTSEDGSTEERPGASVRRVLVPSAIADEAASPRGAVDKLFQ